MIAVALQQYGLIVADNGINWFFQGAPSAGWNDDDLNQLKGVPGDGVRSRRHRSAAPVMPRCARGERQIH